MSDSKRIAVVGAGVIGLTTAIRFLESDYSVDVIARDLPPNTTSNVAAAFWCPYRAKPQDRVLIWARDTYSKLREISQISEAGVYFTRQRELFKTKANDPWYLEILENFGHCPEDQLPEGFVDAYEFDTYRMETAVYMQYLLKTCEDLGASIQTRSLDSLTQLAGHYDLVVNCSGVWARHLVDDEEVYPIRGQVISVEKQETNTKTITVFDGGDLPTYLVPRSNDWLLGGTAQDGNWDLEPNEETAAGIRTRCEAINSQISSMKPLKHKVGLRPGRSKVRIEYDDSIEGLPILHNYGHGGSGFTLSWGCADEVLGLLDSV